MARQPTIEEFTTVSVSPSMRNRLRAERDTRNFSSYEELFSEMLGAYLEVAQAES